MSSPFLAEIKMFAGNFAPKGWAFCNGQLLSIAQNTALFSLLGTNFGGNGTTNFGLPNLQGMAPLMAGQGLGLTLRVLGETAGNETVTLHQTELPAHSHGAAGSSAVGGLAPSGNVWSKPSQRGIDVYTLDTTHQVAMSPLALNPTGGGQPHNNLMPYLVVTFIIALQGIFPSRN